MPNSPTLSVALAATIATMRRSMVVNCPNCGTPVRATYDVSEARGADILEGTCPKGCAGPMGSEQEVTWGNEMMRLADAQLNRPRH